MKKALLALNFLILAAVGYLFFLHYNSKKNQTIQIEPSANHTVFPANSFHIAYFEMDSIERNYEVVKEVKKELNKREDQMNNELDMLDKSYHDKANEYQRKAATMSQTQSEQATQELMKMQEDIKNRKQFLLQDFSDFKARRTADIQNRIKNFLQIYNKTRGFDFIASDDPGLFYYKDTAYNITKDVVNGLNEIYWKTQGK